MHSPLLDFAKLLLLRPAVVVVVALARCRSRQPAGSFTVAPALALKFSLGLTAASLAARLGPSPRPSCSRPLPFGLPNRAPSELVAGLAARVAGTTAGGDAPLQPAQ